MDLFAEYTNCTVVGLPDVNGSLQTDVTDGFEVDFLRNPHGLFGLERLYSDAWRFARPICHDMEVKCFIANIVYMCKNYGALYGENFLKESRTFLDRILEDKHIATCAFYLSGKFQEEERMFWGAQDSNWNYCLKRMTVSEFRSVAREYVSGVKSRLQVNTWFLMVG